MKFRLLSTIVLLMLIGGCSKKKDPEPALASQVIGTYKVTRWANNGGEITLYDPNDPKGAIRHWITYQLNLVANESNQVESTYRLWLGAIPIEQYKITWIWKLNKNGNNIDIYQSNSKIGSINGSTLELKYIIDDITSELTAIKQ